MKNDHLKTKEQRHAHYLKYKAHYVAAAARRTLLCRQWVRDQKAKPCADCKQSYPYYVMDFDHLGGKKAEVNTLARKGLWKQARAEIAKCEVVCSNCHRIRSFARLQNPSKKAA